MTVSAQVFMTERSEGSWTILIEAVPGNAHPIDKIFYDIKRGVSLLGTLRCAWEEFCLYQRLVNRQGSRVIYIQVESHQSGINIPPVNRITRFLSS